MVSGPGVWSFLYIYHNLFFAILFCNFFLIASNFLVFSSCHSKKKTTVPKNCFFLLHAMEAIEAYLRAHHILYHRDKLKLVMDSPAQNNIIVPGAILKPYTETVFQHKDSLHRMALYLNDLQMVAKQHGLRVYVVLPPDACAPTYNAILKNYMDVEDDRVTVVTDLAQVPTPPVTYQVQQQGVLWTIASDDTLYTIVKNCTLYVDQATYDAALTIMTVEEEARLHMVHIGVPPTPHVGILTASQIEQLIDQGSEVLTRFVCPVKMVPLTRAGPAIPLRLIPSHSGYCTLCGGLNFIKYLQHGRCRPCNTGLKP